MFQIVFISRFSKMLKSAEGLALGDKELVVAGKCRLSGGGRGGGGGW